LAQSAPNRPKKHRARVCYKIAQNEDCCLYSLS
jgi:hypothetical protein